MLQRVFVIHILLFTTLLLSGCKTSEVKISEADLQLEKYQEEVDKIKYGDEEGDVVAMRLAYIKTPLYNPYKGFENRKAKELKEAISKRNIKRCLELANKILDVNYASMLAHFSAHTLL